MLPEVQFLVYRSRCIRDKKDPIVPHEGVTGRRLTAAVRHDAGDNDLFNASGYQEFIETGPIKDTVTPPLQQHAAVFLDVPMTMTREVCFDFFQVAGFNNGKHIIHDG